MSHSILMPLLVNSIDFSNYNLSLLSVRISASELASHPLVHLALASLNSNQFLEAAVNGIVLNTPLISIVFRLFNFCYLILFTLLPHLTI